MSTMEDGVYLYGCREERDSPLFTGEIEPAGGSLSLLTSDDWYRVHMKLSSLFLLTLISLKRDWLIIIIFYTVMHAFCFEYSYVGFLLASLLFVC
jgi:hypothetical protein